MGPLVISESGIGGQHGLIRPDRVRRAVGDLAPARHDDETPRDAQDGLHVVIDDNERPPTAVELANPLEELVTKPRMNAGERLGGRPLTRCPRTRTSPPSAARWPVSRLMSVVLPEPFGPISPTRSPAATTKSTASFATMPPNHLTRPTPRTSSVRPLTCRAPCAAPSAPRRAVRRAPPPTVETAATTA